MSPVFPPRNSRHRSRRLRKKMRLQEFQEMGFEIRMKPKQSMDSTQQDAVFERFLTEVLEVRDLAYGGSDSAGYITRFSAGSVDEDDRLAVLQWLKAQPEYDEVMASPLSDAWYPTDEELAAQQDSQ